MLLFLIISLFSFFLIYIMYIYADSADDDDCNKFVSVADSLILFRYPDSLTR